MDLSKTAALLIVLVFSASIIIVDKPVSAASTVENSWIELAPMQQARAGSGVVAVNDKIYAIGGSTASGSYPPDIFAGAFVAVALLWHHVVQIP